MRITQIIVALLMVGLLVLSSCVASEPLPPIPTSTYISQLEAKPVSFPIVTPVFADKTAAALVTKTDIVYVTQKGETYHRAGCRYLFQSQIPIERSDAVSKGYTPCFVCQP